jgi:hypothetical protein
VPCRPNLAFDPTCRKKARYTTWRAAKNAPRKVGFQISTIFGGVEGELVASFASCALRHVHSVVNVTLDSIPCTDIPAFKRWLQTRVRKSNKDPAHISQIDCLESRVGVSIPVTGECERYKGGPFNDGCR